MSVLKIKDSDSGQWQGIASIQGEPGQKGETGGVNDAVKLALLKIANHVWYDDDKGPQYIQDLQNALFPPDDILSITAVYTPSGTVYDSTELDDLKADLVVKASKPGGTTQTIPAADYTLLGELIVGTSTISVIYRGYVTTFDVVVAREPNGFVDGTYSKNESSVTVEDGVFVWNTGSVSYQNCTVPFQKQIKLKAGDVLSLSSKQDDPNWTSTKDMPTKLNSDDTSVKLKPGLYGVTTVSRTIPSDMTATALVMQINGGSAYIGAFFTISVSVNGEVVI